MTMTLWRAFPWDLRAAPGAPFSPGHLPEQSGQGRFDLPSTTGASAWYLAESPEHAIGEKLQHLRNRSLHDDFLFERGRRLAVCAAELADDVVLADLCDPGELARRALPPDRLAYRDRAVTQAIARDLHPDEALAGFRWWSALFGEWHTVVLFSDRMAEGALAFGEPGALELDSVAVVAAADALGIEVVEE